jgi:hypothetical protein
MDPRCWHALPTQNKAIGTRHILIERPESRAPGAYLRVMTKQTETPQADGSDTVLQRKQVARAEDRPAPRAAN